MWVAGPATPTASTTTTGIAFAAVASSRLTRATATVVNGSLPDDVAWGTGGVPVVALGPASRASDGPVGCTCWTPKPAVWRSTPALAPRSLGIAHAAVVGKKVLFGSTGAATGSTSA